MRQSVPAIEIAGYSYGVPSGLSTIKIPKFPDLGKPSTELSDSDTLLAQYIKMKQTLLQKTSESLQNSHISNWHVF
jgi:hypothetical protein